MCKGVAAALHRFPRARTCIIVLYEMHLRAALFAIGSPYPLLGMHNWFYRFSFAVIANI